MRTANTEKIEVQRQRFHPKLEGVIEKVDQAETRSELLKEKIRELKLPQPMQEKRSTKSIPAGQKVSLGAISTPAPTNLNVKSFVKIRNYALIAGSKPT